MSAIAQVAKDDPVERLREAIGLSRPQAERLLDDVDDSQKSARVREIKRDFAKFQKELRARVELEMARPTLVHDGKKMLSTAQVSRALGIDAFRLTTMRQRGKLDDVYVDGQRFPLFEGDTVIELIYRTPRDKEHHAPIAPLFIQRVEDRRLAKAIG